MTSAIIWNQAKIDMTIELRINTLKRAGRRFLKLSLVRIDKKVKNRSQIMPAIRVPFMRFSVQMRLREQIIEKTKVALTHDCLARWARFCQIVFRLAMTKTIRYNSISDTSRCMP